MNCIMLWKVQADGKYWNKKRKKKKIKALKIKLPKWLVSDISFDLYRNLFIFEYIYRTNSSYALQYESLYSMIFFSWDVL